MVEMFDNYLLNEHLNEEMRWQLERFHGQRSLVSYSPRDRKETDMTEPLHFT